jgi:peptidyl-prolyl cis-trans isomerase D
MLQFIRSQAGSFFVKLLFVLLIGSFGIWGVGDFLRQKPALDSAMITVGSEDIQGDRVQTEFRRGLDMLRKQFGGSIDADQARAFGLVDRTVNGLVDEALFDQEAKRLHVVIGDQQVRAAITDIPGLKGPDGRIDRAKFITALQQNNMTEAELITEVRADLRRETVGSAANATPNAAKVLVDTLYDIRNEHRLADTVFFATSVVKDLPAPDDAALQAYYDQHHDEFTAPEYRGFTTLVLQTSDVAASVNLTDDMIKTAYDKRLDEQQKGKKGDYFKPENRHVMQMLLPDEAKADEAEKALASGTDFTEVAKTIAKQDPTTIDLGLVEKADLPTEVAAAAFEATQGEVTKPVHSVLGWHVLKVTEIVPESLKALDEVKPQLQDELRADAERDALDKLSDEVQNALSRGADLAVVAEQYNLKPVKVEASDEAAKDQAGNPISALPIPAGPVLKTAFDTNSGETSSVEEAPGGAGYYVVKVDAVIAPALRPFDTIKDKAKDGWTAAQRIEKVAADGKALADAVKPDESLAKLATERKLALTTTKPFTRTDEKRESGLPPEVIAALFKGEVGTVATGAAPDGFYVAQLKEIQPAKPDSDANAVAQLKRQLDQQIGTETVEQFELALRDRYPVDIRHDAVDKLLGGSAGQ